MSTRIIVLLIAFCFPLLLRAGGDGARVLHAGRNDIILRIGQESLDATAYVPFAPPPDSLGYPAMLFVHGFGQTKHADTLSASLWAGSGYLTLCYSVRGHGNSTGSSEIMGSAERRDLREIIAYLRSLPEVNPARIGVQGGSQGGLHVFWCAADTLPVAAGTADVISPAWASDLTGNGSTRTSLTFLLFNSSVRYAAIVDTLRSLLRADEHSSLRALFSSGRDVDTASLYRSQLPVAAFAKWQDHYFSVEGMAAWYQRSVAPRQLYCGTGGHFSDNVLPEFQFQWGIVNRWHERFVAGKENGVTGVPVLTIATSALPADTAGTFTWERETRSDWSVPEAPLYRLYLRADTMLTPLRPPANGGSVVLRNEWNSAYPFDSAMADRFTGARFESSLPRVARRFVTRPLQNGVRWYGAPRVHYAAGSEDDRFPLHCQIFEVEEGGESRLINRIPLTVRGWSPGAVGSVEAQGFMHSHRFARGSRIAIELTNIDSESRPGWGTMPFHLPMFRDVAATCYCDSARASYIEFPLVGDPVLRTVVADLQVVLLPAVQRVRVSWNTLGECDNSGFRVMRRKSGGPEETVGFVPAAGSGNSPDPLAYSFEDSTIAEGSWSYRVSQLAADGTGENTSWAELEVIFSGVSPAAAFRFGLEQNFPNPFNPATVINYSLRQSEPVRLEIISVLGERIGTLVDREQPAGAHSVSWNGSRFPSGIYFCRLATPSGVAMRRMLLLR